MELKSEMIVVPVQKKRKFTEDLTTRFVCFDPSTRMIYMSDKAENIHNWKHRMRVYAISLSKRSLSVDFRGSDVNARDLLVLEVNGVTHHRLSPDAAGRVENSQLPNLADHPRDYVGGDVDRSWGTYIEGTYLNRPSNDPVNVVEDKCFFDKERFDWELHFDQYAPYHDLFMCIRDVLIADGLRETVYGGLPNLVDPRNQLHLASIPLHLASTFLSLRDAVVYTCHHTEMIGCNNRGELGVCLKHCYVCITDCDVLFLAEDGTVGRCIPLFQLECVEYNTEGKQPFVSFLTQGNAADVLVTPADMFKKSSGASPSLVKAMPWCHPVKTIENILSTLRAVVKTGTNKANDDDDSYDDDLDILDGNKNSENQTGSGLVEKSIGEPFTEYAENFADVHKRIFKWQPLPGHKAPTPTVQLAAAVAKAHNVVLPKPQDITKRPQFKEFYSPVIPNTPVKKGSTDTSIRVPTSKEITSMMNPIPKR